MNLLEFLNNYWAQIVILISAVFGIYKKVKKFIEVADKEKIDRIIAIVGNIILEKLAKAEEDWTIYKKTGTIKRSKVINEIYESYPILKEYVDQEYIITQIDKIIDDGLKELEQTIKDIKEKSAESRVE